MILLRLLTWPYVRKHKLRTLLTIAGISLGVAIIAVFALFEKKRNEVLQVVEGLKQWER